MKQLHLRKHALIFSLCGIGIIAVLIAGAVLYTTQASKTRVSASGRDFLAQKTKNSCTLDANKLVSLINQARQQRGIAPLTVSQPLTEAAQAWLNLMIKDRFYGHVTLGGEQDNQFLASYFAGDYQTGQMIDDNACNDQGFFNDYMNSPDHKTTMLDPEYTQIGISEKDRVDEETVGTGSGYTDNGVTEFTPNLNVVYFISNNTQAPQTSANSASNYSTIQTEAAEQDAEIESEQKDNCTRSQESAYNQYMDDYKILGGDLNIYYSEGGNALENPTLLDKVQAYAAQLNNELDSDYGLLNSNLKSQGCSDNISQLSLTAP